VIAAQQGSSALLERAPAGETGAPTDAQVRAALHHLSGTSGETTQKPNPSELKQRLNGLLFPSILLIFVALYVTSLAAGVEPEMGLLQAGGVSVVLAVLGRAAVGILGDETRLVLNDAQIIAMARSGAVREYLDQSGNDADDDTEQPTASAQAARAGGKE
jgi:hypothetical protein